MIQRSYYSNGIFEFCNSQSSYILGQLVKNNSFSLEKTQRDAWQTQIEVLQHSLRKYTGKIYFEYSVPRMGRRIDVILVVDSVIFVVEFKVGSDKFTTQDIDQVWDYALDLKNFHETSHHKTIAPILVASESRNQSYSISPSEHGDELLLPVCSGVESLTDVIDGVLCLSGGQRIDPDEWENGRYSPTPTIVEAARALYMGHSVADISRSDAAAINLNETTAAVDKIVDEAKREGKKAICFITGVPGAGKTLVGLNIATKHQVSGDDALSIFLSGNGPLVTVLQEALARDYIVQRKKVGIRVKKVEAVSKVKAFVQNVHHYRDEYLSDSRPPVDHVAIFDEAQRAWNIKQTSDFMKRKKGQPNFDKSEPEFLISCIDRHQDWGVILCLVGGGQEINTGEGGISEWIAALNRSYPHWSIHISSRLYDSEYGAGQVLEEIGNRSGVNYQDELHLSVSMRSFRSEEVSLLVKQILDLNIADARETLRIVRSQYPIVITRSISKAKEWLKKKARGTERYGMVVSSQAERLKPHAIDVRSPMNPINWFLNDKTDVRSSFYMESVATEFHIQGLELDWACITWDADFRKTEDGWSHNSFKGCKWTNINKLERQRYQKNAYRVLLTRARQGMVIVVPEGDKNDLTRSCEFYDPTYSYLREVGFQEI